ncbi:MAG: hypothetical protein H0X29_09275 [Parachlamydiaceae bacterium]|nr:hypothetical protein [Parachlamydiaceae bacterium]
MSFESKQTLKTILHPYLFVLKEGKKIKNDLLDYSLLMLLVNSSETIKSPSIKIRKTSKILPTMEMNTLKIANE